MLTEAQDKMLEALAKRHGITVSALHRRLIDLVLQGFVAVADLDEGDES
jgi:DNA-binding IclR family transcriptional regulator